MILSWQGQSRCATLYKSPCAPESTVRYSVTVSLRGPNDRAPHLTDRWGKQAHRARSPPLLQEHGIRDADEAGRAWESAAERANGDDSDDSQGPPAKRTPTSAQ